MVEFLPLRRIRLDASKGDLQSECKSTATVPTTVGDYRSQTTVGDYRSNNPLSKNW